MSNISFKNRPTCHNLLIDEEKEKRDNNICQKLPTKPSDTYLASRVITTSLTIKTMERRTRTCCPWKKENDEEFLSRIEQERREGRALLREMVVKSDDLDWEQVIKKAEELHRKEETKLMKRERRWRQRETRKVLDQRRKVDAIGSFSVNLLTMKACEEDNTAVRRWRQRAQSAASASATSSNDESDTRSMDVSSICAPTSTPQGVAQFDEGKVYYNDYDDNIIVRNRTR